MLQGYFAIVRVTVSLNSKRVNSMTAAVTSHRRRMVRLVSVETVVVVYVCPRGCKIGQIHFLWCNTKRRLNHTEAVRMASLCLSVNRGVIHGNRWT